MTNTLTWLHLSDLHMQRNALHGLSAVLDALWRDLPEQIAEFGGQLDFIAFTGDIAFSGKAEEYELAEEHFFQPLLKATGLTRERLFIVPGNHDVDWEVISLINPQIARSLSERNKVTDLLKDDFKRRLLFSPMANYTRFVQDYFASFPDHPILRDPPYYYVQHISLDGRSVALIGLNSSWFSGFTKGARGKVTDRGNLLVGDKQIGDAIRAAGETTVCIALMHHPPSCFKEFDQLDVERWLRPGCEFVLLGHLHVPNFLEEKALGRETINIPCGTIYKGREWLNGYNLVQLDFATGTGKIVLRRYVEERHEWIRDIISTGEQLNGIVEFNLPGSLAQATSPARQILSEIKPIWLRLGRERETQLLETFVARDSVDTLWIWGEDDCGLTEFLHITQALLDRQSIDVIYFDAEEAASGIVVDQYYFLGKLEKWAKVAPGSPNQIPRNIDGRLKHLIAGMDNCLSSSGRRMSLIFANYHLLIPTVREWVRRTLWDQLCKSLQKHKPLAIFACEGSDRECPARSQKSKIHLGEFTIQEVEQFLKEHSFASLNLVRKIHSGSNKEFLVSPKLVYQNLIAELTGLSSRGRHDEN